MCLYSYVDPSYSYVPVSILYSHHISYTYFILLRKYNKNEYNIFDYLSLVKLSTIRHCVIKRYEQVALFIANRAGRINSIDPTIRHFGDRRIGSV